jgi:hypothetical protein
VNLVYFSAMRRLTQISFVSTFVVSACGGGGGGGGNDADNNVDTPNVPAMITVSGTASSRSLQGTMPVEGVAVGAFQSSDENTAVVTATTDAQGNYTLMIPTGGHPVDGFIKATKATFVDTYLYPPAPLVADFAGGSINLLTTDTYTFATNTLCQGNQDAAKGVIGTLVQDSAGTPVGGVKVDADPVASKSCYDSGGVPTASAMMTDTDGVALLLNVLGAESLTATKAGVTFKSHTVKVFAGAFTTTLITQ